MGKTARSRGMARRRHSSARAPRCGGDRRESVTVLPPCTVRCVHFGSDRAGRGIVACHGTASVRASAPQTSACDVELVGCRESVTGNESCDDLPNGGRQADHSRNFCPECVINEQRRGLDRLLAARLVDPVDHPHVTPVSPLGMGLWVTWVTSSGVQR